MGTPAEATASVRKSLRDMHQALRSLLLYQRHMYLLVVLLVEAVIVHPWIEDCGTRYQTNAQEDHLWRTQLTSDVDGHGKCDVALLVRAACRLADGRKKEASSGFFLSSPLSATARGLPDKARDFEYARLVMDRLQALGKAYHITLTAVDAYQSGLCNLEGTLMVCSVRPCLRNAHERVQVLRTT